MPTQNVKKEVRYLNKDFTGFRDALVQHAKTYFPSTYNDFSDTSLGMMLIEMSAYVGDVLSYYMDDQIKETMLNYATQRGNVVQMAQALGYKPKPTVPAIAKLKMYQLLPAITVGGDTIPDYKYALNVREGLIAESSDGIKFRTNNQVDFATSSSLDPTTISVYSIDDSTNLPTQYLLTKEVFSTGGEVSSTTVSVGAPRQFHKIKLPENNIIRILSCVDSNGRNWHEVPYLAQDVIFEDVENQVENDPELSQYSAETPYLLKLKRVPRRFVTRVLADNTMEVQFGAGISTDADEELIPNPENIGLQTKDGRESLNAGFDPSNFTYTKAYGEAPSNVTMTVSYLTGRGVSSNVGTDTINKISSAQFYENPVDVQDLDKQVLTFAKQSVAVTNPDPAEGGRSFETTEEIRQNALAAYGSQMRAVTREDYIGRLYSMPAKYGSIAKAYIVQDYQIAPYVQGEETETESNPLALNLYLLQYDQSKKLSVAGRATKENIKTYLSQYRMMTDAINIKNAYVINIGIVFEVIARADSNGNEVLLRCINMLKQKYTTDRLQINEPIMISDIFSNLASIEGVQSVTNVNITNKVGGDYSSHAYDIKSATINKVLYPSMDPACFEIKYPNDDIIGRIATY